MKSNHKIGALKRSMGIKGDFKTGEMITKMNEKKVELKNNKIPTKSKVAIMGTV